jgi:3-oxoacyl-(acyl-carrier-protein) synthase
MRLYLRRDWSSDVCSSDLRYALSNNIGLGGHNAAIIFKRWDGR